jgi:hypothetical protein
LMEPSSSSSVSPLTLTRTVCLPHSHTSCSLPPPTEFEETSLLLLSASSLVSYSLFHPLAPSPIAPPSDPPSLAAATLTRLYWGCHPYPVPTPPALLLSSSAASSTNPPSCDGDGSATHVIVTAANRCEPTPPPPTWPGQTSLLVVPRCNGWIIWCDEFATQICHI